MFRFDELPLRLVVEWTFGEGIARRVVVDHLDLHALWLRAEHVAHSAVVDDDQQRRAAVW